MANQKQVLELYAKNPKMTCKQIADKLDCMPEYVRKTFYRQGVSFALSRRSPVESPQAL